ncbi:MAG: OmpH family outer membrane protein [Acidobacteria bacterium]|nr:OmpH family outer membrane protein [Acidobacteriota bacterium]
MRVVFVAASLSLVLLAGRVSAQNPAPAEQPPAPQPAAQAAPQPPSPFPEGAKIAFIDIQRVASESAEGKTATAKVQALNQKKVNDLNEKQKALQAGQQKLQTGLSVMSESARGQLEKDVERMQVEVQRYTQDAQAEVQDLQQDLQAEFQKKLMPVIQQIFAEKGLLMLFSRADAGIVWADSGLDITSDVIKRFDAATVGAKSTKPPGQ